MNDTKKSVFNADAAEEYFSDLLTFYRNTANDIFRRDNDGRPASKQIYSAEYQKFLGMQAAMREVLEYFSKFDLYGLPIGHCCECGHWTPSEHDGGKTGICCRYTPNGYEFNQRTAMSFYCGDFEPREDVHHD